MLHLPTKANNNLRTKRHRQVDDTSHPWQHRCQGNISIKYHSSCSIERDAGGSESALCSLSQSICRSCVNDIRVGKASRLYQYPITQILIRVMSKILTSHMLQGNFTTKKVTSLEIKANSVEPFAFLPLSNESFQAR
jgi:hypothetical protein